MILARSRALARRFRTTATVLLSCGLVASGLVLLDPDRGLGAVQPAPADRSWVTVQSTGAAQRASSAGLGPVSVAPAERPPRSDRGKRVRIRIVPAPPRADGGPGGLGVTVRLGEGLTGWRSGGGVLPHDPADQDPRTVPPRDRAHRGTVRPERPAAGTASTGERVRGTSGRGSVRGGTGSGTTAAGRHGWGRPTRVDEFDGGLGGGWGVYDGPGHGGNGRRTPDAVMVRDGILVLTGDAGGSTAGMAWNPGQMYGRWEARVRAPAADPSYHALLLLWPDAENWPEGGEVDFMEMMEPDRQETKMFLHYGADNSQLDGTVRIDATQWHNWAVEWTPTQIAAFVDGREWWRTTDASTLPPGPMHLCIQLDWFPEGSDVRESRMEVDWVRQYPI